jgi:hypothetical protein
MTSFLSFHAAAAARGDGLNPKLLASRIAPHADLTRRHDGMIQSGPDPVSEIGGRTSRATSDAAEPAGEQRVWRALQDIPAGEVVSHAERPCTH